MKIMVFDVPATTSGALGILESYYNKAKTDEKNEYIFVLSIPSFEDTKNIKVINFPWIKKSWLHRLYFDWFIAYKLIKEHYVEEVLSLQNLIIPRTKLSQTIYIHNAIPFTDYKFNILKNPKLWVYKHIMIYPFLSSIKKADKIIVQTNSMKNRIIKKKKHVERKIEVQRPQLNLPEVDTNKTRQHSNVFFYPANPIVYKNHMIILKAAKELKELEYHDYTIVFTIDLKNRLSKKLYNFSQKYNLPVKFDGYLEKDEIFEYYKTSILTFPSSIETVGLPLLEAMHFNAKILVVELDYAYNILNNYNKFLTFKEHDYYNLTSKMKQVVNEYKSVSF